jgi:hypothetical protein
MNWELIEEAIGEDDNNYLDCVSITKKIKGIRKN